MDKLTTYLANPGPLKALYTANALWFSSAFVSFAFRQPLIMRAYSRRKRSSDPVIRNLVQGDAWHHDIMAYLGAMNGSLVALALMRLYALNRPSSRTLSSGTTAGDLSLDISSLIVLGLANFSQGFTNFAKALTGNRWVIREGVRISSRYWMPSLQSWI